tara:strand:+ start:368 stop:823 length:456 start_codon:yes stop_codon:yes gene_type:complete
MVKLRLKERKLDGPLVRMLGGKKYEITYEKDVDVPLIYAVSIMYSLDYKFTDEDRKDFSLLGEHKLGTLKMVTNTHTVDELKDKLSIRKSMFASKKPKIAEKKEKPKKEVGPLPPDLEKLTVKKIQELLDERGISAKGKKADLIKALMGSE